MMVSKKTFLDSIKIIYKLREQNILYSLEIENLILSLIKDALQDTGLIEYKLYVFDFYKPAAKMDILIDSPELETWETLYDYLSSYLK